MGGNDVLNVATAGNGANMRLVFDTAAATPALNTFVGTSATPRMQVTATGITIAGDLTVTGTQTQTTIQSNTVQVGDLNVQLGYEAATLALLDGAGITLGKDDNTYVPPTLAYRYNGGTSPYFEVNNDLRAYNGTTYATVAKGEVGVTASLTSYSRLTENVLNFSEKWRLRHNSAGDTVVMEHYESSAWVTKFTFAA
jgi:hypothetical protein